MNKLEIENKLKDNKLPERWEKFRLGEIIVENIKSRFKVEDADNYGGYPFFTSGEVILSDSNYLVDYENVFLATGGVANIKYYKGKANYSADTYCLKAKITTKYLYYFLLKNLTKVNYKYFSGSGLKHLQKNDFKKEILIFPSSLSEQQKIAEILERVDEIIEKTDAIIEKYIRIKQGLMQNLLTKGIDENGQIRSEETHKFKDSPLGRIPEEWEVVELGVVGSIVSGSTPSTNKAEFWNGNIVWITPDDLSKLENKYICTSSRKISKKGLQRCSAKMIPKNSIVISSRAPIGYLAISKVDMATNQGCKSIVLKNLFDVEFIYYCLHLYITKMIMLGSGTTFSEISKTELNKLKIVIPKFKEEQQCITSILFQIDETVEKEQNYKEKLERIKQGLMEDLLTGRVRVNHLIEEGAESV